jgi:hypothetical protein
MEFDDCYEDFSMMDFVDEIHQTWNDDEDDDRTFSAFLNSNWDF